MQFPLLLTPLLAAFAVAQTASFRVQLSNDAIDAAVQANIPANGLRISIKANFGNLGSPIVANRALIVGAGSGRCNIFSDAAGTRKVATIVAGGNDVNFGAINLDKGVIVCQ
ncbi:hypothetical protein G6011_00869 [Alternaria panax]|uniref:Uncharacterized protein n=1 Tax=Alternaria panax TaxID=48097 RepID=A0AAD4IJW0_9PLEO|nr:hypothetical protein G6011_00869 [Alternaria panax]